MLSFFFFFFILHVNENPKIERKKKHRKGQGAWVNDLRPIFNPNLQFLII